MKNQNPFYRFWNPYHKIATPGFTVGCVFSFLAHLPIGAQVVLCCVLLFHLLIELILVLCIWENERIKRKIAEEDAKALRDLKKNFTPDLRFLISKAPNLSDSAITVLSETINEFYNINVQSPNDEVTALLGNITAFPYYGDTANSPPQTHSRTKNEKKEKSYK